MKARKIWLALNMMPFPASGNHFSRGFGIIRYYKSLGVWGLRAMGVLQGFFFSIKRSHNYRTSYTLPRRLTLRASYSSG